jgi:hypothetical protein
MEDVGAQARCKKGNVELQDTSPDDEQETRSEQKWPRGETEAEVFRRVRHWHVHDALTCARSIQKVGKAPCGTAVVPAAPVDGG